MRSTKQSPGKLSDYLPEIEVVLLGILAAFVLQIFRAPMHRWLPGLWLETLLFLAAPIVLFGLVIPRLAATGRLSQHSNVTHWLQGGVLIYAVAVFCVQWFVAEIGAG